VLASAVSPGALAQISNRTQLRFDASGNPPTVIRYAPVEDGIREEFWPDRIQDATDDGASLVICGCLHCLPLAAKAEKRKHRILFKIFHPEIVRSGAGALLTLLELRELDSIAIARSIDPGTGPDTWVTQRI